VFVIIVSQQGCSHNNSQIGKCMSSKPVRCGLFTILCQTFNIIASIQYSQNCSQPYLKEKRLPVVLCSYNH
jgi:hypothetical protein